MGVSVSTNTPYADQGYSVALYFFLYIKEAFGWEPFKRMYAEYRTLQGSERPSTEQQKIDQLALRLSRATGVNLSTWFDKFRFPLSPFVRSELSSLPRWENEPF